LTALRIDESGLRFRALIGTGGIGSGTFFALNGNHTLGREESRSGHFLNRRDYCKLHIVSHYVRVLVDSRLLTLAIGAVGDDETGRRLVDEMEEAGIDLRYVQVLPGEQTMFAICLVYPDGGGGNLTVDDSACARIGPGDVAAAGADFARYAGAGLALALPEVPLAARGALLSSGRRHGFFNVASFTSEEIASGAVGELLQVVDLVALNVDEAAALAGVSAHGEAGDVVISAVDVLGARHSGMQVSITAGGEGSWVWDGVEMHHLSALDVSVVSTAGAGDAHLAGVLSGLVAGLDLREAHQLGVLVAGLSVTSPHTIHEGIDRASLAALAEGADLELCARVRSLLDLGG
jgi:ribokinase